MNERWVATSASAFLAKNSLQLSFEEHDLPPPRIALTSDSGEMNRQLVAESDLLGVATRRLIERYANALGLKIAKIADLTWRRPVAVVYRKGSYLSPVARRFINILESTATKIQAKEG